MSKVRRIIAAGVVTFSVSAGIMGGMTVLAPAAHATPCKQPCSTDCSTSGVICQNREGGFTFYCNICLATCAGERHCFPAG